MRNHWMTFFICMVCAAQITCSVKTPAREALMVRVVDQTGDPLPGVRIIAQSPSSESRVESVADPRGNASLQLSAGQWKLWAELPGAQPVAPVAITVGEHGPHELMLELDLSKPGTMSIKFPRNPS